MSYYFGIILSTIVQLFNKLHQATPLLPTSISNDIVRCRDYDLDQVDFAAIGRPFKANLATGVFLYENV
jgi:hypothetical protein